jgi:hypothetical protein
LQLKLEKLNNQVRNQLKVKKELLRLKLPQKKKSQLK